MLTEAATTASILLRALCQLLPDLLGHGPVAARAAELYRPSSYQNQLRVATSPSPVPGASPGGAPRAREAALEASARLRGHLAYSNQAKEFRKHHGHSKSAEQHRALDVWEVNALQLGDAVGPTRGHAGFWHVPRVKFVLRSSLEVLYLGLLAWVLLRERACVGAAGELLPACNPTLQPYPATRPCNPTPHPYPATRRRIPTLHATPRAARLQARVHRCAPETVTACVHAVISM